MRSASIGGAPTRPRRVKDVERRARERRVERRDLCANSAQLRRVRQAAVQEQVRHFFEAGVGSEIFDGVSGDRQPAGFAVDMTEPGRVPPRRLPSPVSCFILSAGGNILSILILQSIYRGVPWRHRTISRRRQAAEALGVTRGDPVRVHQPWSTAVGAGSRPAARAPLLPGGRRATEGTKGGAPRDPSKAAATGPPLGRAGAGIGHHADSRRDVLLSRPRCGARSRHREPGETLPRCCGRPTRPNASALFDQPRPLDARQLAQLRAC